MRATVFDNCQANGSVNNAPIDCTGANPPAEKSILLQALYYVCEIDRQRANNSLGALPPLKLSFGLYAGNATPAAVQNALGSGGTIDLPTTNANGGQMCARFPAVYLTAYPTLYRTAFNALLSFLAAENDYTGGPEITIAKIGGIDEDTAELVLNGDALAPGVLNGDPVTFATDPGPDNIDCTWLNNQSQGQNPPNGPANHWLTQYESGGIPNTTFAQSIENTFGSILGTEFAGMTTASTQFPDVANDFLLSIATRNGQFLPDIDCGVNNTPPTGGCAVDNPYQTGDQWSAYYLIEAVQQLGDTTSGAYAAALGADKNFGNFNFTQLALDYTSLTPPPTSQASIMMPGPPSGTAPLAYPGSATDHPIAITCYTANNITSCPAIAINQVSCNLNNMLLADRGTYQLMNNDGMDQVQKINGVGTLIGWQTNPSDFNGCSGSPMDYPSALAFGINNGGQYIEISVQEATNVNCQPFLVNGLSFLLGNARTHCLYATN